MSIETKRIEDRIKELQKENESLLAERTVLGEMHCLPRKDSLIRRVRENRAVIKEFQKLKDLP